MNTKKLLLLLTLASPLMADPSSATPSPDQPIQDPWKQFKASHSLILFLNNTSTKANRCSKVRLDDLQESPRTLTEEDYDPNWVGGSGKCRLLPKETELVSLIPRGTGAVCSVYEERGTNEEGCTYLVVIMPDPFKGKFFEIRCGSVFQCRAAIVVPNQGPQDEMVSPEKGAGAPRAA